MTSFELERLGSVGAFTFSCRRSRACRRTAFATLQLIAATAILCSCSKPSGSANPPASESRAFALSVSARDTRFDTRDHFIAALEMQLSGEPFAGAMGRDVSLYNRDYTCQESDCSPDSYPDENVITDAGTPGERSDLAGFSSGIESYEYSKQPMNNIAFESGAGTSLLFGPVLNPDAATGVDALQLAQAWLTKMASASNATRRVTIDETHRLGWPGFWPTLQPFTSWDPAIDPTPTGNCSLTSDDNRGPRAAITSNDYECDYTTLNLRDRTQQVAMEIGPGASGWSDWKQALWTLNYLQVMHDSREGPVENVVERQLSNVGVPGNLAGPGFHPGSYLGSSDIEGFQAGNFIQILDNQAAQWLFTLSTSDGATLDGFSTLSDALAYQPSSELRWFPESIAVTEAADDSGFPRPVQYTITSPDSQLLDLAGLLGAYASAYSLTDTNNLTVGGSQPARVYFDGSPFPVQPQTLEGTPSLHDRSLAMLRVLLVNIDRLHVEHTGTGDRFSDHAAIRGKSVMRGTTLSSDVAAYALLALRTTRRGLDSALTLYSNTTPDTANIPSPLDRFEWSEGVTYAQRLDQLIGLLSRTFYDDLTSADGRAFAGWDLTRSAPTGDANELDAQTAAIRGLLTAYLATGEIRYRTRALAVFRRLESAFYDPSARVYRSRAGDRSARLTFTPRRFGLLQAALRDTYELIAVLPGNQNLRAEIEDRVGRLNKLVLNGWDDRNQDQHIDWPQECAQLGTGPDGAPLGLGGLQMAERTLSGESGALPDDPAGDGTRVRATDREHDCVPEISAVGLPAALANSITFRLTPMAAEADSGAGGGEP